MSDQHESSANNDSQQSPPQAANEPSNNCALSQSESITDNQHPPHSSEPAVVVSDDKQSQKGQPQHQDNDSAAEKDLETQVPVDNESSKESHRVTIVDFVEEAVVKEIENVIGSPDVVTDELAQDNKEGDSTANTKDQCTSPNITSDSKSGEVTSSTGNHANNKQGNRKGGKPNKSGNYRRNQTSGKPIYTRRFVGYYQVQNSYGIKSPPYKSNFEPSETARQRADEFLKLIRQQ